MENLRQASQPQSQNAMPKPHKVKLGAMSHICNPAFRTGEAVGGQPGLHPMFPTGSAALASSTLVTRACTRNYLQPAFVRLMTKAHGEWLSDSKAVW